MSNIIPFKFDGAEVRVIEMDGVPWFVGKDVADRLGYADTTKALKQHCRGGAKRHPIVDALGRIQKVRILSEPDVLRLIMGSTLPAAQQFERWIFEEVLPTIRRTGAYVAPGAPMELSPEVRSAIGGIAKAVIGKAIEPILAKMNVLQQIADGFDPTQHTVVGYRPMLQILEGLGIPQKGRRPLVQRCSLSMRKWATPRHDVPGQQHNPVQINKDGKYLFHVDDAKLWLVEQGNAVIRQYRDKMGGQGHLRLVSRRSAPPPPPAA